MSERHFGGQVPTIYSKRLVRAHNDGLTCKIQPGLVDVAVKTKDWEAHLHPVADEEELSEELRNYFSSHPKVIEAAVETQLRAKEPEIGPLHRHKALFFVDGIDAGKRGAEYYTKRAKELGFTHLKAGHIHGNMNPKDRNRVLQEYAKGELTALFNDNILTFGFDDQETPVIHNLKMHSRTPLHKEISRCAEVIAGLKNTPYERETIAAIGDVLGEGVVTAQNIGNRPQLLGALTGELHAKYQGRPDRVQAFFEDMQKPERKLSSDNPLKTETSRQNARALAKMEQIFTRATRRCDDYEHSHGHPKKALLLSYRPVDQQGEGLSHVLIAADLLRGLDQDRTRRSPRGDRGGGGGGRDGGRPKLSTTDMDLTVRFDFGKQMDIAEAMRTAREAAEGADKIPRTEDGRWYVQGPNCMRKDEVRKYQFFLSEIKTAQKNGSYTTCERITIPSNLIQIRVKKNSNNYIHPDVEKDLNRKFIESTSVPKTQDGREYIRGPSQTIEEETSKYRFFARKIKEAKNKKGHYTTEDGVPVPSDKIQIRFQQENYIHPDVEKDLNRKFIESTSVPKTQDGREYIRGPDRAKKTESKKYIFFYKVLSSTDDSGYPLEGSSTVPKDEVVIIRKGVHYIHPQVAADLEQKYTLYCQIPVTDDGSKYVQGPNAGYERAKYHFFHKRLKIIGDSGYPLEGSFTVPKDEVVIIRKKLHYIHPQVAADLEQKFSERRQPSPHTQPGASMSGQGQANEAALPEDVAEELKAKKPANKQQERDG